MLRAITPAQVGEVISLLERLSEARSASRSARAAEGQTQSFDAIVNDPKHWELTDYLYALSDEARGELIVLMLTGRGDVDHSYERALETRSKYSSAEDQVAYLISKAVRLAEYLTIGLDAVGCIPRFHR
jgi:hypothetical protein